MSNQQLILLSLMRYIQAAAEAVNVDDQDEEEEHKTGQDMELLWME